MNRHKLQAAFVLHQRNYRDTSRLVELFSEDHGRLTVVARGVRSTRSPLKSVLQPYQPILASWTQRGELGTLTGAETNGIALPLHGDALLSGFYLNELLIRLLPKHEPHAEIFAHYHRTLATITHQALAPALRRFEKHLLDNLGYGLNLNHEANSSNPIQPHQHYRYHLQHGPEITAKNSTGLIINGQSLLDLAQDNFDNPTSLRDASRLLRNALDFYLGDKPLQSRILLQASRTGRTRGKISP